MDVVVGFATFAETTLAKVLEAATRGQSLVRAILRKLLSLFRQRLPYVVAIGLVYSVLKYMRHRRYSLHFKQSHENLETAEFLKKILSQFSPPIHVPLVFRLFYNSFDVRPAHQDHSFEEYKREVVAMPDGEEINLDWFPKHFDHLPADTPVIMLIPGINSDSRSRYAKKYAIKAFTNYGFRTAIFNRRGTAKMPYRVKPTYMTWCDTGDAKAIIEHLHRKFPLANLFLQGISMGACFLQRLCAEASLAGEVLPVRALGCIASPFNLHKTVSFFSKNPLLDRVLCKSMKRTFKEHLHEQVFLDVLKEKNICIGRPRSRRRLSPLKHDRRVQREVRDQARRLPRSRRI